MNRSLSRELVFKLLYELEVQKENQLEQIDLYIENNEIKDKKTIEYLKEIVNGIKENKEIIESLISKNLKKRLVNR